MAAAGSIKKIFGPDGVLAGHLTGYEPRPGQQQMAAAVAAALEGPEETSFTEPDQAACLVVEAETGLGKTLAYLVPAVLSGRKVVVSTNTRNLQDQILQHEIPFIRKYIEPKLRALCVKGRQNYLCLYRWHQYRAAGQPALVADQAAGRIGGWLKKTTFADRAELTWLHGASPLWRKICCLPHFCLGGDCPDGAACFLNRLRREAAASRLLVVNHHLLFSDLAVRRSGHGEVLPRYEAVIFDEAHHVENVATTFFGFSFSRYQVLDLVADVERSARSGLTGEKQQEVQGAAGSLTGLLAQFFSQFPAALGRFPLAGLRDTQPEFERRRDTLLEAFHRLAGSMDGLDNREEPWGQYILRCEELASRLDTITAETFTDIPAEDVRFVHWYERREKNLVLSATPIDVADDLQETLFASMAAVILTSATLSAAGDFTYFRRRLGLPEETSTLAFPSPFDYANRTLLHVPDKLFPEPAAPGYGAALHQRLEELIRLAGGRALVLFTSIQAMENACRALEERLEFPLLLQGTGPRHELLSRFARENESVLFAVSSFWEGVDIPGESLSLVIIDKLPFEVPSDPVIMARINRIRAAGGNPFFDFQVPRAVLGLRQGAGRLMRRTSDRGVIAVLDVRLFTKGYGRRFLKSLPPSPVCRDLDRVKTFFAEEHDHNQTG
ncbi:DinG family ATP-dependent helicase YoaA [hydrothermal vent metagenome]|uniref:DNA 5'-3' helicase n=1 Tax=hydrothermal vent metagenome TaxID=652676 RepID=A0A3B0VJJ7_9ZZZZ